MYVQTKKFLLLYELISIVVKTCPCETARRAIPGENNPHVLTVQIKASEVFYINDKGLIFF